MVRLLRIALIALSALVVACGNASDDAPGSDTSEMAAELPTDLAGLIIAFTSTSDTIIRSLRTVDDATSANAVLVSLKDAAARLGAVDAVIQALDMDAMSLDELDVLGDRAVDLADAQFELDEELDRVSAFDLSAESKAVIEALRLP